MDIIKDIEQEVLSSKTIGGKAKNLVILQQAGFRVPKWMVIPREYLEQKIPQNIKQDSSQALAFIEQVTIDAEIIRHITGYFPPGTYWAVRSSATDEDGSKHSFAGLFESCLYVSSEELEHSIKKVWKSAFAERVTAYRQTRQLSSSSGMAVIIQQMVPATASGVAFGINPVSGNPEEQIINSVYGLGEGLVSGDLDADHYSCHKGTITTRIATKTHEYIFDTHKKKGIIKVPVAPGKVHQPSLSENNIFTVAEVLHKCSKLLGKEQDIEFAFSGDELFLLQSRPITTLQYASAQDGNYILWDNSNIIESYPGVTTPLTFSFISKSYEGAYKLFCRYLGVSKSVIEDNERVFTNTLGLINGRVYYNLKTWYHMLAMLPGYSINARFMEKMMGVKERFDIPEHYRLSKGTAWWRMIRMVLQLYSRYLQLPAKRQQFVQLLNDTISEYKQVAYEQKTEAELMQLYLDFEKKLLNEWKAPLLNDFFAMIWFGRLQKKCSPYHSAGHPNIHNDLLCGSSDIISTQPIHRTIALATAISGQEDLQTLFMTKEVPEIWDLLKQSKETSFTSLKQAIEAYIYEFGERCVGELKLETVSYTQNPELFVKVLQSYVRSDITSKRTAATTEEELRSNAEAKINTALRYKPLKKWQFRNTLRKARELVSSRENLRYERTRAFGIVRTIFVHLGKRCCAAGVIENERDIFYLTKEEIFAFIEGRSVTQDIKALIHLRQQEFEQYKKTEPPAERFATYGMVYDRNNFFDKSRIDLPEGDLKGIGCCPGYVKAKVRVVLQPEDVSSLDGDILVTTSTDPGWVTLFPTASAILVERGSLLSHSAIVSREMGIPCIVSITGLLKTLRTGDEIEMDGGTGRIKIISKA